MVVTSEAGQMLASTNVVVWWL